MKYKAKIGAITLFLAAAALLLVTPTAPVSAAPGNNEVLLAQAGYPRNADQAARYLGDAYTDRKSGFSIQPPGGWYLDRKTRKYVVRFSSRDYHASLMVDMVALPEPVTIDNDFKKFINEKNREVKESIPSFKVNSNRSITVSGNRGYVTEATFTAGVNPVLINIYYIPYGKTMYMITTICPEAEARLYDPLLTASATSFKTL